MNWEQAEIVKYTLGDIVLKEVRIIMKKGSWGQSILQPSSMELKNR